MGAKLAGYFDQAKQIAGLKGQMRMAVLTGVTSAKAPSESDSPDLVAKFESALQQIKKEA